ncbi:apolipoprotein D-like [Boleophthalmus pectinirostris]|uniref:apolipoprotein D-like n=1 Tax=Boleophthalmus pectinirostris TaxID=150288 RepID=UPI000A1C2001|nr:apolipoprotein D-like [Boleophthalmus pectinirostris]
MNALQVYSLALLSVMAAQAQVIMPGRCPQPAVQKDFDAARYLGTWFDIKKLPMTFQKGECSTATYTLQSPGVVGVFNKELLADGTINTITGTATALDPSEPAKLSVSFFENSPPAPYWVLDTDYSSYTLVYSCTDLGIVHTDFAWIMSREPTLSPVTEARLTAKLTAIGVRVDKLVRTVQDEEYCSAV